MKVLHIVPRLKPEICGVGDYALEISRRWRSQHGIESEFLVGDPAWKHGGEVDGFRVSKVATRSASCLTKAINSSRCDAVVLQYSGYGYARRGMPLWLPRGLGGKPLITMFHELYATGAVSSSAFWLSPGMRWVARALASKSSHVFCNREAAKLWLRLPSATVLPVFSNMGEFQTPDVRERWLALFAYQAGGHTSYWERLKKVIDMVNPTRVIALGRKSHAMPAHCCGVPCEETGILPAEMVSQWLARCSFGYLSYNPAFLGKSSILAAFAAHGLTAILADDASDLPEGLSLGRELLPATSVTGTTDFGSAATSLTKWYKGHDLAATADAYAKRLREADA